MTSRPSFLSRTTWGLPHYLWLALLAVLVLAMIPRAAKRALEGNTNKAEDWLPDNYSESVDLRWYRSHFGGEAFAVVSWEGCTLGSDDRLELLATKLRLEDTQSLGRGLSDERLFAKVITGNDLVDQLAGEPSNLSYTEAVQRLETVAIGPEREDGSRLTCLIAYLGPQVITTNRNMRAAIERMVEIATTECNIKPEELHYGGPPVDNVTIDIEAEKTLRVLARLSGLVGVVLAYLCFRSFRVTGLVLFVAVASAGFSLACVFYWSVVEVVLFGYPEARMGRVDAIMMSMPAVVYVLGLSGAIHLVNYYRDAIQHGGTHGAVERSVGMAWIPCGLASFTTAVGLASLGTSDILPIKKFGVFSAAGVLGTLGLLFIIIPVGLHRFAPSRLAQPQKSGGWLDRAIARLADVVCRNSTTATVSCLLLVGFAAIGLTQLKSRVHLLKLLDPSTPLIADYEWLEANIGNLVPMEVIVSIPAENLREPRQVAETKTSDYAMTMYERLTLVRDIGDRVTELEPVSHSLSVATFAPAAREDEWSSIQARRNYQFNMSESLGESRQSLRDYLQIEKSADGKTTDESAELWRVSARVAALAEVDYGKFVEELRETVAPIAQNYARRDAICRQLHEADKQLVGARVAIIYPSTEVGEILGDDAPEKHLQELLLDSGANLSVRGRRGAVLTRDSAHLVAQGDQFREALAGFDAVVALQPEAINAITQIGVDEKLVLDLTETSIEEAPFAVTYTGVMPLVYKTQRQLLVSLGQSMVLACVLITIVMVFPLRSIRAALVSMLPNLFPIVLVFGILGWLGVRIDIGIMMTASVALGVAVDDTLHFVTWFNKGRRQGLGRVNATKMAYARCGRAMVQTTVIAGIGLAVFSASTFTPTAQFGMMMITLLAAALLGDLVMLPAILVGPIGKFFASPIPTDSMVSVPTIPLEREPAPSSSLLESIENSPAEESALAARMEQVEAAAGETSEKLPEAAEDATSVDKTADPTTNGQPKPGADQPDIDQPSSDGETLAPAFQQLRDKLRTIRDNRD